MSTLNVNTLRTAGGASPVLVAEIAKLTDVSAAAGALAASSGSSLVGYMPAGVGAVATTVQGSLRNYVCALDVLTEIEKNQVLGRTATTDVVVKINALIARVAAEGGGNIWFPPGVYPAGVTLVAKTGVKLEGAFGESVISGQTIETGTHIKWVGANGGTILNVYAVRYFTFEGFLLSANGRTGVTGILLDTDNIPGGAMNTFERFYIRDCLTGVQWGTTGISAGSKQNDGTIFRQFQIYSLIESGSKGFVLNSGNSAQYSTIENGGIVVNDVAVDVIVTNQLQLRRVVSGYKCATAFCRVSTGINILIEGCESENQGDRTDGKISSTSRFLHVVAPIEGYPVMDTTIVLMQNTINNPIVVEYPVRIVSTGDAWGTCWNPSNAVIPVTGTFTNGTSSCLALGNGKVTGAGWIPSVFVQLQDLHPEYGQFQKDVMSTPGYAYVLAPVNLAAAVNLATAVDCSGFGGKLWTDVTTSTGSGYGAGKRVYEVNGNKAILTLDESEVVIGQSGTGTRLRFAQLENIPTATSNGNAGQMISDGSYIYVCTATNTWVRAALSTW